jgi:hypothetical protein
VPTPIILSIVASLLVVVSTWIWGNWPRGLADRATDSTQLSERARATLSSFLRTLFAFLASLPKAITFGLLGLYVLAAIGGPPQALAQAFPPLAVPSTWRDIKVAVGTAFFLYAFMEVLIFFKGLREVVMQDLSDDVSNNVSKNTADVVERAILRNPDYISSLNDAAKRDLTRKAFRSMAGVFPDDDEFSKYILDALVPLLARPYACQMELEVFLKADHLDSIPVMRVRIRERVQYTTHVDGAIAVSGSFRSIYKYDPSVTIASVDDVYQQTRLKIGDKVWLRRNSSLFEPKGPHEEQEIDLIGYGPTRPNLIDKGAHVELDPENPNLFPPFEVPIAAGKQVLRTSTIEALLPYRTVINRVILGHTMNGKCTVGVTVVGPNRVQPRVDFFGHAFGPPESDRDGDRTGFDWSGVMVPGHGFLVSWQADPAGIAPECDDVSSRNEDGASEAPSLHATE